MIYHKYKVYMESSNISDNLVLQQMDKSVAQQVTFSESYVFNPIFKRHYDLLFDVQSAFYRYCVQVKSKTCQMKFLKETISSYVREKGPLRLSLEPFFCSSSKMFRTLSTYFLTIPLIMLGVHSILIENNVLVIMAKKQATAK